MNVNRSSTNLHVFLESCKHLSVALVTEPHNTQYLNVSSHPAFKILNPIHKNTKICSFLNRKHPSATLTNNRSSNILSITPGYSTFTEAYMDCEASIEQFRNDLQDITSPPRNNLHRHLIMGEFNCPNQNSNKGQSLYDGATAHNLKNHIPADTITFCRTRNIGGVTPNVASRLDLVFSRSNTTFLPIPDLYLQQLGSDHLSLASQILSATPPLTAQNSIDCRRLKDYVERNPKWKPSLQGRSYTHLLDLRKEFQGIKYITPHSKRWWNQELTSARKRAKKDASSLPAFKKLVKNKKREEWAKFIKEQGHRNL